MDLTLLQLKSFLKDCSITVILICQFQKSYLLWEKTMSRLCSLAFLLGPRPTQF